MRYWVDAADRLAQVDDDWRAFAVQNGAPELASESVLGRPLCSFCSDLTTTWIWALLLTRARSGATPEVHIRCDSPDLRRLFVVSLAKAEAGLVRVAAELASEERRPHMQLLEVHRPHAGALLLCCSWCKKLQAPSGVWLEVEDLLSALRLMEAATLPAISHGICAECRARFKRSLEA